jgi:hypothetical protein
LEPEVAGEFVAGGVLELDAAGRSGGFTLAVLEEGGVLGFGGCCAGVVCVGWFVSVEGAVAAGAVVLGGQFGVPATQVCAGESVFLFPAEGFEPELPLEGALGITSVLAVGALP